MISLYKFKPIECSDMNSAHENEKSWVVSLYSLRGDVCPPIVAFKQDVGWLLVA
jgi:hypothetical protein